MLSLCLVSQSQGQQLPPNGLLHYAPIEVVQRCSRPINIKRYSPSSSKIQVRLPIQKPFRAWSCHIPPQKGSITNTTRLLKSVTMLHVMHCSFAVVNSASGEMQTGLTVLLHVEHVARYDNATSRTVEGACFIMVPPTRL